MFVKGIFLIMTSLVVTFSYSQDSSVIYFALYAKTINENPCQGLKYLDKAIATHPRVAYYQERAMTNLMLGNYLDRIQDLKKAISLISKDAKNDSLSQLYYDLAGAEIPISLRKSNRYYKRAARELIKAKLKYVFDPSTPKWIPVLRLSKEDYANDLHWYDANIIRNKDSIGTYKKALRVRCSDTMSWGYYIYMGSANFHLHHYKTALRDYDKAVTLYPNTPIVYNSRGLYNLFRGNKAGARSDFEKSFALSGFKRPIWLYPDCDK